MKIKTIVFALLLSVFGCRAQNLKSADTKKGIPETFVISKNDINNLLSHNAEDVITDSKNQYINNSQVQMVSASGDMKSMRVKMSYFSNANLFIQVNGSFSTQVFVMSEDKSFFYTGVEKDDNYVMTKCTEEDIISE